MLVPDGGAGVADLAVGIVFKQVVGYKLERVLRTGLADFLESTHDRRDDCLLEVHFGREGVDVEWRLAYHGFLLSKQSCLGILVATLGVEVLLALHLFVGGAFILIL